MMRWQVLIALVRMMSWEVPLMSDVQMVEIIVMKTTIFVTTDR